MGMAKERLIWDSTDAANSDNVGTAHSKAEDAGWTTGDYGAHMLVVRKDDGIQAPGTDQDYASLISDAEGHLWIAGSQVEDLAHSSGDRGIAIFGVHQSSQADFGQDGDYVPFSIDDSGQLRVTGGGTEFAEDVGHTTADAGRFVLSVRVDDVPEGSNAAFLADTEGDYQAFLTDARGALWTADNFNEDQAHTSGDAGSFILAVRNDAGGALATTTGDYIPLTTDATGNLRVTGGAGATTPTDDFANPTDATNSASFNMLWDGATWDRAPGNAESGAFVAGLTADDVADAGNPVKVGTRAVDGALSAISTTGDRANMISDMYRRTYVNGSPNVAVQDADVSGALTVSGVAVALVSAALAGRTKMIVQNVSSGASNALFIGGANLTASNGIRLSAGATVTLDVGEDISLSGISSGTASVRILELA
jgi:hypothetical protein